jgi:hypothetical protein
MPSVLLGFVSGGTLLISGNPYSGLRRSPVGCIRLKVDLVASGPAYIGLSGGVTVLSGGFALSGGGSMDGTPVYPGEEYTIPALAIPTSGTFNLYAGTELAASGRCRVYYEVY